MTLNDAQQMVIAAVYDVGKTPMVAENEPFNVEEQHDPWYRVTTLVSRPTFPELTIESAKRHPVITQVDVFHPIGTYDGGAKADAQDFVDAFWAGRVLGSAPGERVRIRESWWERGPQEPSWYHVLVQIRWIADVVNKL